MVSWGIKVVLNCTLKHSGPHPNSSLFYFFTQFQPSVREKKIADTVSVNSVGPKVHFAKKQQENSLRFSEIKKKLEKKMKFDEYLQCRDLR